MPIHVALSHTTRYRYDRPVSLSPHVIRLRPAPHCRTPVLSYALRVAPRKHFVNWQQDPHSNYLARLVFPDQTRELSIEVDLVAEMSVFNPFDFFLEPSAEQSPFQYEPHLAKDLAPFLETAPPGPRLREYVTSIDRTPVRTIDALVDINRRLAREVAYIIRLEPGVQTPEETLTRGTGSCRDTGWLLVQVLRHLGYAARFVSGYLVQLVPDVKPLDGPAGPAADFTDLHAWTEVYLPGAGWIGFDPTSGLLAGEGHIPLAATPEPRSAAPVTGGVDECEVVFSHEMHVRRIFESPRVTRPYSDEQWQRIDHTNMADLSFQDQVTRRVEFSVGVPYFMSTRSQTIATVPDLTRYQTASRGIGDIVVATRRWMFDPDTHTKGNVKLGAGIQFPTGSDNVQDTFLVLSSGVVTNQIRNVDQSIQPGEGGWGYLADVAGFRTFKASSLYVNAAYLLTPQENNGVTNGTATSGPSQYMSVYDQFFLGGGIGFQEDRHAQHGSRIGEERSNLEREPARDEEHGDEDAEADGVELFVELRVGEGVVTIDDGDQGARDERAENDLQAELACQARDQDEQQERAADADL